MKQLETFLRAIFEPGDIVEMRSLHRERAPMVAWLKADDSSAVQREALKAQAAGCDVYVGANPRARVGGNTSADVALFRSIFVDLDNISEDDGRIQLMESGLPEPTLLISSGRGLHAYWRLTEPVADPERWRTAQRAAIARVPSADKAIHDPARIMRLPGTINTKVNRPAKILVAADTRHRLETFLRPEVVPAPRPATPAMPRDTSAMSRYHLYLEKTDPAPEGRRNQEAYRLACVGMDFDLAPDEVLEAMRWWNAQRATPPLEEREFSRTVLSAVRTAKGERGQKNRPGPLPAAGGSGSTPACAPAYVPAEAPQQAPNQPVNQTVLEKLVREVFLIVGTTQVWHAGLCMSMPLEALMALYPIEGKIWRQCQDRRTVRQDDIVFEPGGAPPEKVNLWRGLHVDADPRPCPLLVAHLDLLTGGDAQLREWLVSWLAIQVQRPGQKLDTAVIVQGKPGSGKSIFFNCFRAIFGEYGCKATQSTLDSDYTGWMSKRLFVQCEEVGSTRQQVARLRNVLKDWITGETMEIREKYQVSRHETAHANFVFLSNDSVPLPIDPDDRRFCVIRHDAKPDRDYFTALGQEIEDNGPARLYGWLLQQDLGEFWQHSPPPHTAAKADLTDLCKPSPALFEEEWLSGNIELLPCVSARGSDLYAAYAAWAKLGGYRVEAANTFHKSLKHSGRVGRARTATERFYLIDSDDLTRFEAHIRVFLSAGERSRLR